MKTVIIHWRDGSATTESMPQAKRLMLNALVSPFVVFVEFWNGY